MSRKPSLNTSAKLLLEIEELRARLLESEEALNAMRSGDVDAIIVSGEAGEQVFSLTSSETPYRIILEEMDEGAVITDASGRILYFNKRFEAIFSDSHTQFNDANITEIISGNQKTKLKNLLEKGIKGRTTGIIKHLKRSNTLYLNFSIIPLSSVMSEDICIITTKGTEGEKGTVSVYYFVRNLLN